MLAWGFISRQKPEAQFQVFCSATQILCLISEGQELWPFWCLVQFGIWGLCKNMQAALKGSPLKMLSSQSFWAEGTKLEVVSVKEVLSARPLQSASVMFTGGHLFLFHGGIMKFCTQSLLYYWSPEEKILARCMWKLKSQDKWGYSIQDH